MAVFNWLSLTGGSHSWKPSVGQLPRCLEMRCKFSCLIMMCPIVWWSFWELYPIFRPNHHINSIIYNYLILPIFWKSSNTYQSQRFYQQNLWSFPNFPMVSPCFLPAKARLKGRLRYTSARRLSPTEVSISTDAVVPWCGWMALGPLHYVTILLWLWIRIWVRVYIYIYIYLIIFIYTDILKLFILHSYDNPPKIICTYAFVDMTNRIAILMHHYSY